MVPFDIVSVLGLNAKFSIEIVLIPWLVCCCVQPERKRMGVIKLKRIIILIFVVFSFFFIVFYLFRIRLRSSDFKMMT